MENTTATPATPATPATRFRDFEARLLTGDARKALTRAGVLGQTAEEVLTDIVVNLDAAPAPEWEEYVRANAIPERASISTFWLGCSEKVRSLTPSEIFAAATSPDAISRIEASPEWKRLSESTARGVLRFPAR